MFCLPCLSLVFYFVILGIFIPSKRKFIKDAFRCFWKKLTLQHCTDSFDDLMHKRFVMWLAERDKMFLVKVFKNKKHFDITIGITGLVFSILNSLLFYLLYKFLFIKSPCDMREGVCYH